MHKLNYKRPVGLHEKQRSNNRTQNFTHTEELKNAHTFLENTSQYH